MVITNTGHSKYAIGDVVEMDEVVEDLGECIKDAKNRLGYSKEEAAESAASWQDTFDKASLGEATEEDEE